MNFAKLIFVLFYILNRIITIYKKIITHQFTFHAEEILSNETIRFFMGVNIPVERKKKAPAIEITETEITSDNDLSWNQ